MAIYVPGNRDKRGRESGGGRDVIAALSMASMVDLFTVLVVFLLQNYATTGQVIDIPPGVKLPQAHEVKDLTPANVVIVSNQGIQVNNDQIMDINTVRNQADWELAPLKQKLQELIAQGQQKKQALGNQIRSAVERMQVGDQAVAQQVDPFLKLTIQADKHMDFLTLKKVMYTATDAGIVEINFAVMKEPNSDKSAM